MDSFSEQPISKQKTTRFKQNKNLMWWWLQSGNRIKEKKPLWENSSEKTSQKQSKQI